MKKKPLLTTLLLTLLFVSLYAHEPRILSGFPLVTGSQWTVFQVSLWPVKFFSGKVVYGVNLSPGAVSYQGKICGISLNLFVASTIEFYGIQCAPFCMALDRAAGLTIGLGNMISRNHGVMLGIVNNSCPPDKSGQEKTFENFVQIGIFNMAGEGLQIGLVNYNPNARMPWTILCNYSCRKAVEK